MEKPSGFNLKYLFAGAGAVDWWKAIGLGWRLGVTILIIILLIAGAVQIKNFLFPQTGSNVHRPTMIALPGSHIGHVDQSAEQKTEVKKRPWFLPIPFISIYGGARTRQATSFNFEPEYGAQVGIRWDFD
jgi:hypothetical protein